MKNKIKFIWIFVAAVILTAVLLLHYNDNELLPDDLAGRWTTSVPEYAERFLELSQVTVIFGIGKDNIVVNFISSVDKRTEDGVALYTIRYRDLDKTEGYIAFYWYPSEKVIRLKNQKQMIWKKTKEPFRPL